MCYAFIKLTYVFYFQFCICYTDQLWQDGHLVLGKVGIDRESMVYPLTSVPHPPPPLRLRPPLPLVPPGPYTQEFVMIPNPRYHNLGPQPLFP